MELKISTIKSVCENIATGTVITLMTTIAQVGLEFYKISQFPTAAQFGSQCLSTLAKGGLVFGAAAVIALAVDVLFDKIKEKAFECNSKTTQAISYLLKRAITVICVGGFALLMGSSLI